MRGWVGQEEQPFFFIPASNMTDICVFDISVSLSVAQSTHISVTLQGGGMKQLRIEDNGCGIRVCYPFAILITDNIWVALPSHHDDASSLTLFRTFFHTTRLHDCASLSTASWFSCLSHSQKTSPSFASASRPANFPLSRTCPGSAPLASAARPWRRSPTSPTSASPARQRRATAPSSPLHGLSKTI